MKIFKQETNKSCGVACLRSIFNYYGDNFSEKDIWNKNKPYKIKEGIRNPIINLGVTALKLGFKVKYIGYNPIIANNNQGDLEKSLIRKQQNYFGIGKFYINNAVEFLKLGGEIVIDKLNIQKLKKIIDKNKFILVEIKPAFINKKCSLSMNHKVIIDGYNKKGFHILNPSGKKEIYDFDDFLLAFYAAVSEILIIKNRR